MVQVYLQTVVCLSWLNAGERESFDVHSTLDLPRP